MTDWRIMTSPNFAADSRKEILPRFAALISAYGRMICDDWVLAARDAHPVMQSSAT